MAGLVQSIACPTSASRRQFLGRSLSSFGALAFNGILSADSKGAGPPLFPPRAKSVIYLYMEGGPSQVDTFDPKPLLRKRAGEPLPFETPATVFNISNKLMPSPFKFRRYGESGITISELFPNIARNADQLTVINSMHHGLSNHSAACYFSHTGDAMAGRPSVGSWLSFGLGSVNDNLPSFVVLDCGQAPSGGSQTWSSGFLPATHEGVRFREGNTPVEFLNSLDSSKELQLAKQATIETLYREKIKTRADDEQLKSIFANYRKAARMQVAVPDLLDLTDESAPTRQLYGVDNPVTQAFGKQCLIARRLVEAGVRFIEVFSPRVKADRWDQHNNLKQGHLNNAAAVDQPIAGLIHDLDARGLLDSTIVLWGGEFGRTPSSQGSTGRDHNPFGYSVFLAGGGFRAGYQHGATDEFGYYAIQGKVHLHDLHATILHQMGIDHKRLTYRYAGRDYRLTDVHGRVVQQLIS